MTQGRKIAFAYVFAVPAVLAVVFFERFNLLRVGTGEAAVAQATDVLRNCDAATALLREPEVHPGSAYGIAAPSHQGALPDIVQRLRELTRSQPVIQSQLRAVDSLVSERAALGQSIRDSAKNRWPVDRLLDAQSEDLKLSESIANVVADIRATYQLGLQRQGTPQPKA